MRQKQLFFSVGKNNDMLKRTFLLNIPSSIAEFIEAKLKVEISKILFIQALLKSMECIRNIVQALL